MGPLSLKDTIVKIAPAWLQDLQGAAFLQAVGDVKDSLVEQAKQAVMAKVPSSALAPSSALDAIGQERMLPRGKDPNSLIEESDAAYASRLQAAFDAWAMVGTPQGMLKAFYASGYSTVKLGIQKGRWHELDANQNLVTTAFASPYDAVLGDPKRVFWSQFVVYFAPVVQAWVVNGVPSENSAEGTAIKLLIQRWKPAFSSCWRIAIQRAGGCFGYPTTQLWGDGSAWGSDVLTDWSGVL